MEDNNQQYLYQQIKTILDNTRRQSNSIYFILILFYDWLSHKSNWLDKTKYNKLDHELMLDALKKEIKLAKDYKNEQSTRPTSYLPGSF